MMYHPSAEDHTMEDEMPEPGAPGGPEAAAEPPRLHRGGTETLVVDDVVDSAVVEAVPPTKAELLKTVMREHERLTQISHEADQAAKTARAQMFAAGDEVQKLARELLRDALGSEYDARLVLYHLTGRSNHK